MSRGNNKFLMGVIIIGLIAAGVWYFTEGPGGEPDGISIEVGEDGIDIEEN